MRHTVTVTLRMRDDINDEVHENKNNAKISK